jgi:hypothetical protein
MGRATGHDCDLGLFRHEPRHARERALGNLGAVDGDQDPGRHRRALFVAAVVDEVPLAGEMKRTLEQRQPRAEHGRTDRLAGIRRPLKQVEGLLARPGFQCGNHDALHVTECTTTSAAVRVTRPSRSRARSVCVRTTGLIPIASRI